MKPTTPMRGRGREGRRWGPPPLLEAEIRTELLFGIIIRDIHGYGPRKDTTMNSIEAKLDEKGIRI
jgi:hypothetical protein